MTVKYFVTKCVSKIACSLFCNGCITPKCTKYFLNYCFKWCSRSVGICRTHVMNKGCHFLFLNIFLDFCKIWKLENVADLSLFLYENLCFFHTNWFWNRFWRCFHTKKVLTLFGIKTLFIFCGLNGQLLLL